MSYLSSTFFQKDLGNIWLPHLYCEGLCKYVLKKINCWGFAVNRTYDLLLTKYLERFLGLKIHKFNYKFNAYFLNSGFWGKHIFHFSVLQLTKFHCWTVHNILKKYCPKTSFLNDVPILQCFTYSVWSFWSRNCLGNIQKLILLCTEHENKL